LIRKNIVANFLGRGSSVAANYVFVPFYVAILGTEAYGIIAFYAILQTFSVLADVGLSAAFSRQAARAENKKDLFKLLAAIEVNLIAAVTVISAVLFFCAEAIATFWLPGGKSIDHQTVVLCLQMMAIMLTPQLAFGLYLSGLLGLERQVYANLLQVGITLGRSGLVLAPILWRPELPIFFGWQLAATFAFALAARTVLTASLGLRGFPTGGPNYAILKPHLAFASGMFAISVVASVNTQVDKIVVSKLFSMEMFGYYALASMLAQLPVALTSPIGAAIVPRLTALSVAIKSSERALLYEDSTYLIAALSSAGALSIMMFPHEILDVWLLGTTTPDFLKHVLMLLALGSLLMALSACPFYLGLAHGHTSTSIAVGALNLLIVAPLLYLSISHFGMLGAAVPWITCNLISALVLTAKLNKKFYRGCTMKWLLHCVGLPIGTNAVVLASVGWLADTVKLSPFVTCAAVTLACVGSLAFLALLRWKVAYWLDAIKDGSSPQ
jgi:O-antigen/teichoic acid export membrane protein